VLEYVFFAIFLGFNRWKSVESVIHGLGRLHLKNIWALRCLKFLKSSCVSSNPVLRTVGLFSCYVNSPDFNKFCSVYGVSVMYMNFSKLTFNVYEHFRTSVCYLGLLIVFSFLCCVYLNCLSV